ncbi:membrane protein of unknown function [Burkholderia multivorans]
MIFSRPGSVNSPAPFLWIEPSTALSSAASTAFTAFSSTAARSAMCDASDAFVKVSLIGVGAAGAFATAFFATTFFAGAAFLAATFLAGAAAFLATFFAEVAMFLLPGVVVGYAKRATRALQGRILQALRRFVQYFYAEYTGFQQVLLHAAHSLPLSPLEKRGQVRCNALCATARFPAAELRGHRAQSTLS